MSAIASISIDDGQVTPVTHQYNPVQTDPPLYRENGDGTIPVFGQPTLMLSLKESNGGNAVNRAKVTIRVPVLETTSGSTYSGYEAPPKVAYFMLVNAEFLLPSRSTGDQRKDLRVLLTNLLANSQVVSLIDDLEKPY